MVSGSLGPAPGDFKTDLPERDPVLHPPFVRLLLHLLRFDNAFLGGRIASGVKIAGLLGLPGWEIACKLFPRLYVLLQCELIIELLVGVRDRCLYRCCRCAAVAHCYALRERGERPRGEEDVGDRGGGQEGEGGR